MSQSASGSAFADVYRGPLEDFVQRRDALAKELRAVGDRAGAAAAKALRKPTRTAWALNLGAVASDAGIAPLVAAVAATIDAQATGSDVRGAIARLRTAVREFADAAARAATIAGHPVGAATLASGVLAVLGTTDGLSQLSEGRLTEVPEAGALDFLTALPARLPVARTAAPVSASASASAPVSAFASAVAREDAAAAAAAQAAARKAALADAQRKHDAAQRVVDTASVRVREAEAELEAARTQLERATRDLESAAASLRAAKDAR